MDLMGGQVVRAVRGERHNYRPIVSSLCASSEPLEIARAFLELYPFRTLYIADLDAIQGRGNHLDTVAEIRAAIPELEIWIDAGFNDAADTLPWVHLGARCVIGSESLPTINRAMQLLDAMSPEQAILSLDYSQDQARGPIDLFANSAPWPARIIGMTLGRVGSYRGPDIALLQQLRAQAGERKVYAAGGVRDTHDLQALKSAGIAGALIASAIHDKHLTAQQLTALMQ